MSARAARTTKPHSLGKQLTRRVIVLSVIAGVSVVAIMALALALTVRNAQARLQREARDATLVLDQFLLKLESDVSATSSMLANSQDVRLTLLQMRVRYPQLLDVVLLDTEGNVVAQRNAMGRSPAEPIPDGPWEPVLSGELDKVYMSPVLFQNERPYVEMAAYVIDEVGLPTGVLLIRVDLTPLWTSTISWRAGKETYAYIAAPSGQIVAFRNLSQRTEGSRLDQFTGHLPHELANNSINMYTGLSGNRVFGVAQQMGSADWYVIVEQPVDEALRGLLVGLVFLLAVLIVVVLLVVSVNIFARQRILIPLKTLSQSMQEIEEGNLASRVELQQNDELGQLGNLFNSMTARLQEVLGDLLNQASQVQQIIDTVPEGVILLDQDYTVVSANPIGQKNLAVLGDAGIGDPIAALGNCKLTDLLTSPPAGLWHDVASVDEPARMFEAIARPIETGPITGGWVLVVRDVTSEREQQMHLQTQDRLASVGQLAAGIAHDFNNILAVVILRAQIIQQIEQLSPKADEYMESILDQARRAAEMIVQILDYSRRSNIEPGPMDLHMFLKEQMKLMEHAIPENIHIQLVAGRGDYITVADPTRIQQVAMNLVINARDAMPDGGALTLTLGRSVLSQSRSQQLELTPGKWIVWQVTDTGTGIPDHLLPNIFEPFVTTKEPGKGTGLGLAQVYGIVKQHGGSIEVTSTVGEGTTFTIYLPVLAGLEVAADGDAPVAVPRGSGETILLVEDDDLTRQAVRDSLLKLGYDILAAENGVEGLLLWETHSERIALVISDMIMPTMGGIALFHALQSRAHARDGSRGVKMILMTGHVFENQLDQELDELKTRGLCGWIRKPLRLETIAQMVHEALANHEYPARD